MILVALGANLPSPIHGDPRQTLEAALGSLDRAGLSVVARSAWYETAPVPVSDQPWYVNDAMIVTVIGILAVGLGYMTVRKPHDQGMAPAGDAWLLNRAG